MTRRHRMPKAAMHVGRAADIGPEQQADATILAAHSAYVRGLERRNELGVATEKVYWPTAMFAISLEEIRLLLAELPAERTPERLRPLRTELEECYRLGVVGAGAGAQV